MTGDTPWNDERDGPGDLDDRPDGFRVGSPGLILLPDTVLDNFLVGAGVESDSRDMSLSRLACFFWGTTSGAKVLEPYYAM